MNDQTQIDFGDFIKLGNLGEGTYGKVFKIKNVATNEIFAAKINNRAFTEINERDTLIKEIDTYSEIQYPTILRFYGYHEFNINSKPHIAIITEYATNKSLQEMLDNERKSLAPVYFEETNKYIIILGISLGMEYLHSNGIVHRDLKPANILLNDQYYPLICDFGLSKITKENHSKALMKTRFVGTPLYMAPEVEQKVYTRKVDVYSFALIVYEIITNKYLPIENLDTFGEENQEFIYRCLSTEPTERPSFHEISQFIVKKCFIEAFGNFDIDKVLEFLDWFEDDEIANFTRASLLLECESEDNKEEAINILKKLSNNGNADAMISYANILRKESNMKEAANYYKMAADNGSYKGMLYYSSILKYNKKLSHNKNEANKYFQMAMEKGNDEAMLTYAIMLKEGDCVPVNLKESAQYFKQSINKGNDKAMLIFSKMLRTGDGFAVNKKESMLYLKKSADSRNVNSIIKYASKLKDGDDITVNKKKSIRIFQTRGGFRKFCFNGKLCSYAKKWRWNYYQQKRSSPIF